ncbi:hypothetical protein HYPBUDRAFT_150671 [Hyphopichia burtonii NRRL Y-1933]|uniref:PCI domain-containing protein n=1 Tax=Hyphopichia burtonii NRRL Y-1933 TaxID=984485 RepID=A0A1E4RDH2_9ASCO|nr:hypothetical protein HYPBUDRAFT_150671 [Hyphopichia burtonii NRRL Y-1933]ODV65307.1 hypothetical protein HYPBUDRAFT_150671 [Hyphopichia burtonii NRRL Y-1933]
MAVDIALIQKQIEDPQVFSYVELLYQAAEQLREEEGEEKGKEAKIINTLELYSFGTYREYKKKKQEYTIEGSRSFFKLVELSVISVVNDNIGRSITLKELLEEYEFEDAIKEMISEYQIEQLELPFVDTTTTDPILILELILIAIKYKGTIDVRIDEKTSSIEVIATNTLRDVYDDQSYQLKSLSLDDITNRSLSRAKTNLCKWLDKSFT